MKNKKLYTLIILISFFGIFCEINSVENFAGKDFLNFIGQYFMIQNAMEQVTKNNKLRSQKDIIRKEMQDSLKSLTDDLEVLAEMKTIISGLLARKNTNIEKILSETKNN